MGFDYFCAYHDMLETLEPLNDGEKGRLFTACLLYSKTGEVPQLNGNERFIFPSLKAQIDRDKAKYDARCEKNRENGIKGGRPTKTEWFSEKPKKTERFLQKPNKTQKTQDKEKDKEKDKEEYKEKEKEKESNTGMRPVPGGVFDSFGNALQAAVSDWLKYKREKRQEYKPTGQAALMTQIKNKAETYGEDAVAELIRQCMSANYQGIIWDKLTTPKPAAVRQDEKADVPTRGDIERMQRLLQRLDGKPPDMSAGARSLKTEEE